MAAAAEKHAQLERWFYDAPLEMFANLSDMWVNDPRFKKNIDKPREGLAEYERAAVKAWVASQLGLGVPHLERLEPVRQPGGQVRCVSDAAGRSPTHPCGRNPCTA